MRVFEYVISGLGLFNLILFIVAAVLFIKEKLPHKVEAFMNEYVMWGKSFIVLLLCVGYYVAFNGNNLAPVGWLMLSEIAYVVLMIVYTQYKENDVKTYLATMSLYVVSATLGLLNIVGVL